MLSLGWLPELRGTCSSRRMAPLRPAGILAVDDGIGEGDMLSTLNLPTAAAAALFMVFAVVVALVAVNVGKSLA